MDSITVFLAKDLIVGVVLIGVITWLKLSRKLKKEFIAAFIIAGIAAYLLTKLAGALYYHPRPFISQNIKPLIAHGNDNGFPSEHTVLAATITALVYYYRKKFALIALVFTLAIGAGRVWAHVHSPIDILGGLIIGLIAGSLGYLIARQIISKPAKPLRAKRAA
jgi:undecaprenyl-diphosphatase